MVVNSLGISSSSWVDYICIFVWASNRQSCILQPLLWREKDHCIYVGHESFHHTVPLAAPHSVMSRLVFILRRQRLSFVIVKLLPQPRRDGWTQENISSLTLSYRLPFNVFDVSCAQLSCYTLPVSRIVLWRTLRVRHTDGFGSWEVQTSLVRGEVFSVLAKLPLSCSLWLRHKRLYIWKSITCICQKKDSDSEEFRLI